MAEQADLVMADANHMDSSIHRKYTGAKNLIRVELMPYNALAGAKYRSAGLDYAPRFDVNAKPNAGCVPFARRGIPCMLL